MKITAYGEPYPKGRPKIRVIGRFPQVYTPPKTREAESTFLKQVINQRPEEPFEGPLSVSIAFFKLKPKSYKKDHTHWDKKPDLDNLIKLVLDALNKVFWKDDAQVVELKCTKAFAETPRTEVIIRNL